MKKHITEFLLVNKTVFSKTEYVLIAIIAVALPWILFNTSDQVLFFSPSLTFYVSDDAWVSFVISSILSILIGVMTSASIYSFFNSKSGPNAAVFSGSSLGIISGACVSCSSISFYLITLFGTTGTTLSGFLTYYQVPIRLIAVGFLLWSYYSMSKKLKQSCASTTLNSSDDSS